MTLKGQEGIDACRYGKGISGVGCDVETGRHRPGGQGGWSQRYIHEGGP